MECPYCGSELQWEDGYGNHEYICHGDINGKYGDIYRCPNDEGFETLKEVLNFIDRNENDLEDYCKEYGFSNWQDIVCNSSCHNVSGGFYTDRQGNLFEGYPC